MLYLGWVGLALGVLGRIFIPWLNARRLNPEEAKWSWRYIWPQLIGVGVVVLALPLLVPDLEAIGQLGLAPGYLVGWGAADLGRFADKWITKS